MGKVLLVDTNLASLPIAESLEAAGHEVHTVGANPRDTLALLHRERYVQLDYSNWQVLKEHFLSEGFDALVPGCNDVSYDSCSRSAEALCLPGYASPAVSAQLNDKSAFRGLAVRLGLPVPRVFSFQEARLHRGPVIVKPVDAFSGRGVSSLDPSNQEALEKACAHARMNSRTGQILIEEFVSGQLFSHSAFLKDQFVFQDVFVQEHCRAYPYAVDTSWVDNRVEMSVKASIRKSIARLASDLGLRDGLLHTQFIVQRDDVWLLEVTLRCPGDLYSRLIDLTLSIGYAENYWRPFLGQPLIKTPPKCLNRVVRHTVTSAEARPFRGIAFSAPMPVIEFYPLSRVGKALGEAPQGRAGILFLECSTEVAQAAASEALLDRSALVFRNAP